jgi:hypothetical protein
MFTGLETKKIMDEEVVESWDKHKGIGPHGPNQGDKQWLYGGQAYDKQITPEMLKGLQNKRIGEVMTRFGDREGAMKMQLDQALLQKYENESALAQGTLKDKIENAGLQNDSLLASIGLTEAQIEESKTLLPHKRTEYILNALAKKQTYRHKEELQPHVVLKAKSEAAVSEDEADVSEVDTASYLSDEAADIRDQARKNVGLSGKIKAEELKLEQAKLTSTYDDELATAIFSSGQAKNEAEAAEMASKLSLQGNKTLTEFATKMGNNEFESPEAQKEWLMNAWDDTHDPRVKAMIDGITAMELSQITAEGTKTMAEINSALTGKSQNAQKDALVKVIDMQDGIQGNMEFKTDKKTGVVTLYEDGKAVITGAGRGWTKFTEQLYAEFTPLKSLEIAKSNADIRYVNAQAAFKEAEAGMKVTLAESKAWGDHTQTDLFKQLVTMTQAELKERTGFDTLTDYAEDYVKRMRDATGVISYEGWTSPDFPPGG